MTIITSVMPKWRFEAARVAVPEDWVVRFVDPSDEDELIAACQKAECLLVPAAFQHVTARVLENCAHLKLVQSTGAGFDGVDIQAAKRLGIPVANVPGQNAHSVAEYTIGLIIALQRSMVVADRETKAGRFGRIRQTLFQQGLTEIAGSSIGLIGFGAIGREVARILGYLGASVSYYSRHRNPAMENETGVQYKRLGDLLTESDVVSLHIPLTDETRGCIGKKELLLMKPNSLLVNTARGEIVDQRALANVLEAGRIAGAAVDVLSPEPPAPDHPLLNLSPAARDRLLVTPHMAGVTVNSSRLMLCKAVENIQRVLNGKSPEHIVNGI